MKKIFTIAILSLCLMSCSEECNLNCGTVVSVTIMNNLPMNGDELYKIDYYTECNQYRTVWIPFNLNYGYPGSPTQPIQRVRVGDSYCN